MKVTKLIIDRAIWGMGRLLNDDNTMCCLGFLALKCGAAPDEIDEQLDPAETPGVDWPAAFIVRKYSSIQRKRVISNSDLTIQAMYVNDDWNTSWEEKEEKLIPLFRKAGIKLSFRGKKRK